MRPAFSSLKAKHLLTWGSQTWTDLLVKSAGKDLDEGDEVEADEEVDGAELDFPVLPDAVLLDRLALKVSW